MNFAMESAIKIHDIWRKRWWRYQDIFGTAEEWDLEQINIKFGKILWTKIKKRPRVLFSLTRKRHQITTHHAYHLSPTLSLPYQSMLCISFDVSWLAWEVRGPFSLLLWSIVAFSDGVLDHFESSFAFIWLL